MSFCPAFGWLDKPTARMAITDTMTLRSTNHLFGTGAGKDALLWEIEEKTTGRPFRPWNQGADGFCVGFGNARSAQLLLCILAARGLIDSAAARTGVAIEPIYGGSRCEVGGWWGDMSDGSLGAYAAKWLKKWGVLLKTQYGPVDLREYDRARCKTYGAKGVPDDIEDDAKLHPVSDQTQVQSSRMAFDLAANGYPIQVCGNTSRTMTRQPGGWCKKTGNEWPHCEAIIGAATVKGNIPALVECNSWGDYLGDDNNLVTLESGREFRLPGGCYLSRLEDRESDFRQGDSFAYADVAGFPIREVTTWLV